MEETLRATATVSAATVPVTTIEHPLRNPDYCLCLIGGTISLLGDLAANWERPIAMGAVLPADQHEDVIEQASRLLRAYFFCAFESQNEGSLATHSAAGMLNSGRTAKILASGPAADRFASASVRVFAAVTMKRTPS
jgi:hypothetical protein